MNTYKVSFQIKYDHLPNKVKISVIIVVVETGEEKEAKIIAKDCLHSTVRANIKSTQIQQL